MLDGWYCRSMANMQTNDSGNTNSNDNSEPIRPKEGDQDYSSDSSSEDAPEPNYKAQYTNLKKKLKYLIYENECFQDALRSSQRRLLRISRDRSYLLDRLLQYERPGSSSSDSDETETSEDHHYQQQLENPRRRKNENTANHNSSAAASTAKPQNATRRKRAVVPKKSSVAFSQLGSSSRALPSSLGYSRSNAEDGHMTPEEVERHLQSRHSYLELLPERAPPTVPTEMFSNEPSLDSESNDVLENSPTVEEWFE